MWNAGQTDEALAAYRRMAELAPGNRSTFFLLVRDLAQSARWVEAQDECRRAFDADPTDYLPPYTLAQFLVQQQRDEDAIVLLRKAADTGVRNGDVYSYLARACIRTDRHEEAVKAWRKATELIPMDAEFHRSLARELERGRAWSDRRTQGDRQVGKRVRQASNGSSGAVPTTAILYPELGTLLRGRGRPKEAAAAFQKAADLDRSNPARPGTGSRRRCSTRVSSPRPARRRNACSVCPRRKRHAGRSDGNSTCATHCSLSRPISPQSSPTRSGRRRLPLSGPWRSGASSTGDSLPRPRVFMTRHSRHNRPSPTTGRLGIGFTPPAPPPLPAAESARMP